METIKKEAIELLKKETTKMKSLHIKNGEFEFKGECADREGDCEIGKIQPGDYFIARRPKGNSAPLSWCTSMDKYDGIIQKCERISFYGSIVSGDPWVFFHPDWCEKVNTGDVMKTQYGNLFIFKCVSGGYYHYFIYCSMLDGKPISLDFTDDPWICRVVHATPKEVQVLFDALKKDGKIWNKEKLRVEDVVWEPKEGDVCANRLGSIFIYKRGYFLGIQSYATLCDNSFFVDKVVLNEGVRLATYKERCLFFERLVKEGYKWNAKKLVLKKVEKWVPKEGEFIAHKDGWIHIHKGVDENGVVRHYAAMSPDGDVYFENYVGLLQDLRGPATESERRKLIDALKKQGKQWNADKSCFEYIPKPKTDEECLRAWGCGEKEINDYLKYREKYEKVLKELQDNSKGYIDSLNARKIFGQLRIIADLHESSTPDRSDVLKKVIKLCEKLLNDEG